MADRWQLAAKERPVEQADGEWAARAEHDDGLHVGVLKRLEVAVNGGDEHADVQ